MDCSKVLGASTTLRWSALVVCRCQGDVSNGRTSAVELVRGRSGLGSEPSLAAADDSKRNSVFVVMYTSPPLRGTRRVGFARSLGHKRTSCSPTHDLQRRTVDQFRRRNDSSASIGPAAKIAQNTRGRSFPIVSTIVIGRDFAHRERNDRRPLAVRRCDPRHTVGVKLAYVTVKGSARRSRLVSFSKKSKIEAAHGVASRFSAVERRQLTLGA